MNRKSCRHDRSVEAAAERSSPVAVVSEMPIARKQDEAGTATATPDLQPCCGRQIMFGPFRLCSQQRMLLRANTPVRLGSRALEVLIALVDRPGGIVKKTDLIAQVWPDTIVEEGTLRVHVAKLRKALGDGQTRLAFRGECDWSRLPLCGAAQVSQLHLRFLRQEGYALTVADWRPIAA